METLYQKRMQPIWAQLTRGITHEDRVKNCKLVLNSREGDYLIKSQNKDLCELGVGYVEYTYRGGWFPSSTRKNAQWFSKQEAAELIKRFKGYKIVKK